MSKYSGLFLSFLLIFICMWINICRCPMVWKMVNGADYRVPGSKSAPAESNDDTNTLETDASPVSSQSFYARISEGGENWPKPVVISASYPGGMPSDDQEEGQEEESVYRQVSYTADQCSAEAVSEAARAEEPAAAPEDTLLSENEEGEIEGVKVHSSYMAAKFSEESSPLSHEFPSYEVPSGDPEK